MKKFLVFLVSLVVVVCVGLTTYYFMRNNEIITIKTKEIYCNAGDTIPLNSLGISIEKANISKKTKFDYNAGGEDVTKFIKYDEESASFVVSQENAGEVTLVIRTTNKKYADFTISVHIGNGSIENPYYIFNESDLMKIGSTYRLDKNYVLMSDITLTSNFKPIGFNSSTESWEGFNGVFEGNGYSIKGLNLADVEASSVGFFSSLGANAKVQNLTLENANITGAYEYAGVLAGVSNGLVEKVAVKNSIITNLASNSRTGSVAGKTYGNMKLSYADNVTINLNGTEEAEITNVKAGGLVGVIAEATVQACYTNNVEINTAYAKAIVGGFAGEFAIGLNSGSIQQSYANTTSLDDDFGAFIGDMSFASDFNAEKANMLRYFIGNIAVVYGVENGAKIEDTKLVTYFDKSFFKNSTYVDRSVFFDKESALYLIRGYASAGEVVSTNEFVYYAVDMNTITSWDTTYVWNTENNSLPTLRMGNVYPADPSGEYFRRNLAQKDMGNKHTFIDTFSKDVENESIKLLSDVDLTSGWTPVAIKNSTIDGNNKTIRINLNNAVDGNLGLFTIVDNSTIKNLNIVVTGVSANAVNAGAVAGWIKSSDELASSTIENVTITYEGFSAPAIDVFGGVAGIIEKSTVNNCSVSGLVMNPQATVKTAGAVAGSLVEGTILNTTASATILGTTYAGFVGVNNGTISKVTADIVVNCNKAQENAMIGGVAGYNVGAIVDATANVKISIESAQTTLVVGGAVGYNEGGISNVAVSGDGISVSETDATIYVGGVAGFNNNNIENVQNNMVQVGSYYYGKNCYVGGVVAINKGAISKVLIQSNLQGNYVGGVVAQMKDASATIDQVVVGKYNAETKELTQNTIKGDKYIAGVVVDFQTGSITNVQSASLIIGEANTTRSSLVALIFTYGSSLKNATIDSSFAGYGETYREVWTDFASYNNKAEFGLAGGDTFDGRFNLYFQDVHHGSMQSVVINGENLGVNSAKASMGNAFAFTNDYQDTAESSFIKVVDGFNDFSQFQGEFEFVCATSTWFGIKHRATRTLTFELGAIWESNNGISLIFLNNIK